MKNILNKHYPLKVSILLLMVFIPIIVGYSIYANQAIAAIVHNFSVFTNNTDALKNNLIAYYKFDEGYGTSLKNSGSVGSAINSTIVSATRTNDGKFGKAIKLSALQYIYIPDNANLDFGTGDFTISTWIKTGTVANNKNLFNKGAGAGTSGWRFGLLNGVPDVLVGDTVGSTEGTFGTTSIADDNWHQLVVVFNRIGNAVGYVDGKQVGTLAISTRNGSVDNAANLNMGNSFANFEGLIDEVKFYNAALSADEVKQDFNQKSTISIGSLSDTSSLAGGSVASNSASAQYCVPGSADPCVAPVGEWNFEEGSGNSLNDISGVNNTATWNGTGSHWVTGKIGKAGGFNGTDDYVNLNTFSALNGATSFTISTWVYKEEDGNFPTYDGIFGIGSTNQRTPWIYGSSGTPNLIGNFETTTGGVADCNVAGTSINANAWNHIVFVWNGSVCRFYINGLAGGTDTTVGNTLANTDGNNAIGRITGFDYWNGPIDQVKVYNYARTPAQIIWDYNQGKPVGHWKFDECSGNVANDSSGKANTGTITIGASGTNTSAGTCTGSAGEAWKDGATGKFNSSLDFDGTDDEVTTADGPFLDMGTMTISAWIKTSSSTEQYIAERNNSTFYLATGVSPNKVCFYLTTVSAAWTCTTKSVSDNLWHHVVGTWDGTNKKLYIDGLLDKSVAGVAGNIPSGSTGINIGVRKNAGVPTGYFTGQIDDVRLYNYSLTPSQIKTLYNGDASLRFGR